MPGKQGRTEQQCSTHVVNHGRLTAPLALIAALLLPDTGHGGIMGLPGLLSVNDAHSRTPAVLVPASQAPHLGSELYQALFVAATRLQTHDPAPASAGIHETQSGSGALCGSWCL